MYNNKKRTQEEFLLMAKLVFDDMFSYDKSVYINNKSKIIIYCKEHDIEFEQQPRRHLQGMEGCSKCKGISQSEMQTKGKEKFIEESKNLYGDKYDYSRVVYKNNKTKVIIGCVLHGDFLVRPDAHLCECIECPTCTGNIPITTEILIERLKNRFDENILCGKIIYKSMREDITIGCSIHVYFDIACSYLFVNKNFCPKCSHNVKLDKELDKELFIKKAVKIHGLKYDYSKVSLNGNKMEVSIICKKHGIFEQTPNSHLRGRNCPSCYQSRLESMMTVLLDNKNITYTKQKKFDGLVYKSSLKFDFYLPDYNTCIECDGKQHYESVEFFGGDEEFKKTQERDRLKNQYCLDNNIKLIRIRYDDTDIEKIIDMIWQ